MIIFQFSLFILKTIILPQQVKEQDSLKQKLWLEETLKNSKADWNIVIGHHPFYTSGKRANDVSFIRNHLEPILEKYKVDASFTGNEHDLQYQKPKDKHTHHFVSGAGSDVRPANLKKSLTTSLLHTKMV